MVSKFSFAQLSGFRNSQYFFFTNWAKFSTNNLFTSHQFTHKLSPNQLAYSQKQLSQPLFTTSYQSSSYLLII